MGKDSVIGGFYEETAYFFGWPWTAFEVEREEGDEFDEVIPLLLVNVFMGDTANVLLDQLGEPLFLDHFNVFEERVEFAELVA